MWVAVFLVNRMGPTLWPSRGDGSDSLQNACSWEARACGQCLLRPTALDLSLLLDAGRSGTGVRPTSHPVCDPALHVGFRFKMASGVWPQEVHPSQVQPWAHLPKQQLEWLRPQCPEPGLGVSSLVLHPGPLTARHPVAAQQTFVDEPSERGPVRLSPRASGNVRGELLHARRERKGSPRWSASPGQLVMLSDTRSWPRSCCATVLCTRMERGPET